MKIKEYINKINNKITRLNEFISNPFNYKNIKTPFYILKPKTYVWLENEDKFNF